jgi:hypothetical protein
MRPLLARFSEPVGSVHLPSWADFITTTPELKFSVHTTGFAGTVAELSTFRGIRLLSTFPAGDDAFEEALIDNSK